MNVSRIFLILGLFCVWLVVGAVGGLYAGYLAFDHLQQSPVCAGFSCGATVTFIAVGVGELAIRANNFVQYGKFRNPCLLSSYTDTYLE